MNTNEGITQQEIEDENISPIIRIFEHLTFERNQQVHDYVTSMMEFFSTSNVN